MSGTLYVAATPIGNLADTSARLRTTLERVDIILAEDTRVTMKLTAYLGLSKRLISYFEHSSDSKDQRIIEELLSGTNYALVSDAGTPAVSDPGARLVAQAVAAGIEVVPIPGPSAASTIVSIFGVPSASYHFWGFFPQKNKRRQEMIHFFDTVPGVHVFFESPFRIIKMLNACFAGRNDFHMVVGREMTKQFETFARGTPDEVLVKLQNEPIKGEFTIGVIRQGALSEDETEDDNFA